MMTCRRLLLLTLLVGVCTGCGSALQRRFRVEEVASFRRYGWTGMDLSLRVCNGSRRTLRLSDARLTLFYGGGELGSLELRGEVLAPARTLADAAMRWRIDLQDPASGYLIEKKFRAGETDAFSVAFTGRVCSGSRCRDIFIPMMPLSDFLAIFGVSLADLQNRIDP